MAFGSFYKRIYSSGNISAMVALTWIFSFGILLLPMFRIWGQFGQDRETFSCTILPLNGSSPKKFLFLLGFALPSMTILICYSIIWRRVRRHTGNSMAATRTTSKRDLKLTKLITVIFLVFVLCFAPNLISNVLLQKNR